MIVLIRKEQPAMDLDNPKDQSACRLLSLPAELRNQIWELVLVQDTERPSSSLSSWLFANAQNKSRFCANVLRTCKQINAEGTPILYGNNIFQAHPSLLGTLPSLLIFKQPRRESLPPVTCPRVANLIKRYFIHVRLDVDPRFSRSQVEESFTGVDELEIEVFQAMYGSCDFTVLKLFEDVRGVGKVEIHGSIGDGRYADWLARTMESPLGTSTTPFFEKYVGGDKGWHAWAQGNR